MKPLFNDDDPNYIWLICYHAHAMHPYPDSFHPNRQITQIPVQTALHPLRHPDPQQTHCMPNHIRSQLA
jgi:hypothetical protein